MRSSCTVHYFAAIEIKHEDAKVPHPRNLSQLYEAMLGAFEPCVVPRLVTTLNARATTACPNSFSLINELELPCTTMQQGGTHLLGWENPDHFSITITQMGTLIPVDVVPILERVQDPCT